MKTLWTYQRCAFLAVILYVCNLASANAETALYKLVVGDTVEVTYPDNPVAFSSIVDIDGNIRLPGLSGFRVHGKTLDEAENLAEVAFKEAGLYIDPQISISIERYAPIVVAGDVTNPGRFDFFPGMTISAALGLAGGRVLEGLSDFEITRAETVANDRLQQASLDIAIATVKIKGLEAFLEGRDELSSLDANSLGIPRSAHGNVPALLASENVILRERLERQRELLRMWAAEITSMEAQSALSTERLDLQNRVVENLESDLANSEKLVERGIQTANRLSEIIQRDANARARALEIENSKLMVEQSISDANFERFAFTTQQRQDALNELRLTKIALEKARLDYRRETETLAALSAANPINLMSKDNFQVSFDILSPRSDRREGNNAIRFDTPLLPGDTLVVNITPVTDLNR